MVSSTLGFHRIRTSARAIVATLEAEASSNRGHVAQVDFIRKLANLEADNALTADEVERLVSQLDDLDRPDYMLRDRRKWVRANPYTPKVREVEPSSTVTYLTYLAVADAFPWDKRTAERDRRVFLMLGALAALHEGDPIPMSERDLAVRLGGRDKKTARRVLAKLAGKCAKCTPEGCETTHYGLIRLTDWKVRREGFAGRPARCWEVSRFVPNRRYLNGETSEEDVHGLGLSVTSEFGDISGQPTDTVHPYLVTVKRERIYLAVRDHPGLGTRELHRLIGLPKSTVDRALQHFRKDHVVVYAAGGWELTGMTLAAAAEFDGYDAEHSSAAKYRNRIAEFQRDSEAFGAWKPSAEPIPLHAYRDEVA